MDRMKSTYRGGVLGNNHGRVFNGFLFGMVFFVALAIYLFSNSVLSNNMITTRNVSVTEDVYVPDQYDYLEEINFTTYRTLWNVSYLYAREDCDTGNHIAEVGTKCWYLDLINSTLQGLNINSTQLLKEINATTYSTNLTATITKKLVGNVLASFGKNLYVVSGDRTSVDENLTGHDGNYEVHTAGSSRTFYFYLEQMPQDNLTVEVIATNYSTSATTRVNLSINGKYIFTNWNFDRSIGAKRIAMVNKTALQQGENTFVLETYDQDVAFDYAVIFTSSAALRFLRATQYNTTSVYNYLTGTVVPSLHDMNDTIWAVYNDTDWLYNNLNCTVNLNTGNKSVCTRLNYLMNWTQFLRANVTDLQIKLQSHNDTIISLLESHNDTIYNKLESMNATIEVIRNFTGSTYNMLNCTSSYNVVCDKLNNITTHLNEVNDTVTYIRTSAEEINTTTHYIWDRWKRRNNEVIHGENITSFTLSSTANVTIWYNITIPEKQGFDSTDFLPVRWKFWFLRWEADPSRTYFNQTCVNQNREFKNVEPYCNPLIAQYIGRPTYNYTLNVSLRPSLSIGNYTIIREVEIDPEHVWVQQGRGPIGSIEVTSDTYNKLDGTGKGGVSADTDTIYIDNKPTWNEKDYNVKLPTPTILTLEGERNILHGSMKVEISDTFIPDKQVAWTRVYDDVIKDGKYELPLVLNLVQGKEYQLEVTICEGPTFDPTKYECDNKVTTFIA